MSISIKFDYFEKIKTYFQRLALDMKEATRETARRLIIRAEHLAKERVKSPSQQPLMGKGNYFRSIKSGFVEDGRSFTGKVESNSSIAGIIEFGSRPHIIKPRDNKLLFWPGAKHPAKKVSHPGTPAFRVLNDATEEAVEGTQKIFETVLKKIN